MTKLAMHQAEVVLKRGNENVCNIGQGEARQKI
jgi:hypothetical protein